MHTYSAGNIQDCLASSAESQSRGSRDVRLTSQLVLIIYAQAAIRWMLTGLTKSLQAINTVQAREKSILRFDRTGQRSLSQDQSLQRAHRASEGSMELFISLLENEAHCE